MNYYPKITKFQGCDPTFYAQRKLNSTSQQLVDDIINLELKGVWLELHGRRLCVCGYTYHHRETFMNLGFKWQPSCKYWYTPVKFILFKNQ